MQVESYEEQEIKNQDPTEAVEHRELTEKLGLAHQVAMHKESGHVDCYRKLTAEELFVFMMNFPNVVNLNEYREPIPLRALQVIAHFRETHPDLKILLLCPEPGKIDPVVIAGEYSFMVNGNNYLLCRFGSALEDFATLRERAFEELERRAKAFRALSWSKLGEIRAALLG